MKHTPGPWDFSEKLSGSENHRGFHLFAPKTRKTGTWLGEISPVADKNGDATPEGWANARLIAAAPDLLEALEALMRAVEDELTGAPKNIPKSSWAAEWDLAEAALRKARGESPEAER